MAKVITRDKSIMELVDEIKEQSKDLRGILKEQETSVENLTKAFTKSQEIISKLERNHGESE